MGVLADLATALDPALILTRAGMTPDPWQARVLRNRPHRLLLNCSRQIGKSQVTAAMGLDEAMNHAPSLVLVLSPSQRQSGELFRTLMGLHGKIGMAVQPDAESSLRAEFPNGSRIIALPGKDEATIRGFSNVSLLIIDEASRVPDDLYNAVKPMLAVSNGRLIVLSSPFGKRGFFFKEWTEGTGWEKISITAEQCPRISKEFLESERRALPEPWFRQEYFCEFAETEGAAFSYDDIARAFDDPSIRPLMQLNADDGVFDDGVLPLM